MSVNINTSGVYPGPGLWTVMDVYRRAAAFAPTVATGGTVTEITEAGLIYRVHTYTTVGASTFDVELASKISPEAEWLVIAGGGSGGGGWQAGGGGAGGYRCSVSGENSGGGSVAETPLILSEGSYIVTVGAGGIAAGSDAYDGENSTFYTITSIGGGGGAYYGAGYLPATVGGSGGGGEYIGSARLGAAGTLNQGFKGGDGQNAAPYNSGGGGGAGSAGADGPSMPAGTGGTGGAGVTSSITGTSVARAGGGGGSGNSTGGAASAGGGTGGRTASGVGTSGTVNTGGGGGGGRNNNTAGGAGGSGIVVIRYPIGVAA